MKVNNLKMSNKKEFIPALRFNWLTNLYDHFMKFTLPESNLKTKLIEAASLAAGQKVLDLGCGTATLTIMIKQKFPAIDITGSDIDPAVLAIAGKKIEEAGLEIKLEQSDSTSLPYNENTFDRVISSLVIHHLTASQKKAAFREVFKVLKPGGEFHILDFSKPHNFAMLLISLIIRHFEQTRENISGQLPEFLKDAGFSEIKIEENFSTVFGTMALYSAKKV